MPLLKDILYKVQLRSVAGNTDMQIADVQIDSRLVAAGTCFVAIKGVSSDGHAFIAQAIHAGAKAIVCEVLPSDLQQDITYVQVANAADAAGLMAHALHGEVTRKMKVVGVTGTNGKTTIATLLYQLFTAMGYKVGLISTVANRVADLVLPSTHTTPDAISLHKLLKKMYDAGCAYVFMECSSHAIHQRRIAGIHFTGAVFSNITHDHLDYHGTFDAYIRAKKMYFDQLTADAFAISNKDDKRGEVMLQNTKAQKLFYSLRSLANFKGKVLENTMMGLHMDINGQDVHFRLIGEFNALNLLAVYGTAVSLGMAEVDVLKHLSGLTGAEGRFDYIVSENDRIVGIVDYAHTPDALLNVLNTLQRLKQGNEHLITVVGCGGDRDAAKRPVMGQIACAHSDKVIFTSDNPRSEDPLQIIHAMESELNAAAKRKYISIADRREAIKTAVNLASTSDIILVAGKGHEKYQEIKGVKHDFDDKQVLMEMFVLNGK